MPTIQDCLQFSSTLTSSDSARLDVELLLCYVLGCQRTYLYTWPEKQLEPNRYEQFQRLLTERHQGRPVAHLVGMREFWSLPLQVNDSTLIPRPDTETLIESVLQLVGLNSIPSAAQVLDLGTGTGAIALALASEFPRWHIDAVDQSIDAVKLAESNRTQLNFSNVTVYQSDWFSALKNKQYHCIVSNPPYIDAGDPHLKEGDVRFEPLSALVAGKQGWADIEIIVQGGCEHLVSGGWLLIEHGYQQGDRARQLFNHYNYTCVRTVKDYGNNDRITLGQWP